MRMHHLISAFALSAVLALGACGGGESDSPESGGPGGEVQGANDGNTGQGSAREGRATLGSETAQEQGTVVNDTTPHRPGSPATP
jgi:hypothetical protein